MRAQEYSQTEQKLIGEIWQNNDIQHNMHYLADRIGNRFAGTESEVEAQRFLLKKLNEYGYHDVHKDEFTYHGWERGSVSLKMLEPQQRTLEAISLPLSPGGEVQGGVIDLGSGSPEEFEQVSSREVEGKIVLCSSATSPSGERVHRRTKYGYAVNYGADAFIFMNHNPGQLPPTGSLRPAYKMGGEIPGIGVSSETGELMRRLNEKECMKVQIRDESRLLPHTNSVNIVADLPGTGKKDEWIVVGGHFDGHDIAQGALDNLSGTAVLLELSRALKQYEEACKRSIRFIFFAAEELGVTGSTAYVTNHEAKIDDTVLMINLELGRLASKEGTSHMGFRVYQPPELQGRLTEFCERIHYPTTITEDLSAASDHWPFFLKGVPTLRTGGEPSARWLRVGRGWGHTSADTLDKVDTRNLQEGAMVLGRLILRLANQEEKIAEKTSFERIKARIKEENMIKTLKIQKKWPPFP